MHNFIKRKPTLNLNDLNVTDTGTHSASIQLKGNKDLGIGAMSVWQIWVKFCRQYHIGDYWHPSQDHKSAIVQNKSKIC